MSFDVYFQRFVRGESAPGGGDRMREVLQPFIVRKEPQHHFALIEYGDGSADDWTVLDVLRDGLAMLDNLVAPACHHAGADSRHPGGTSRLGRHFVHRVSVRRSGICSGGAQSASPSASNARGYVANRPAQLGG